MIKNLRVVGNRVNEILGNKQLKQRALFRSGSIENIASTNEMPKVETIINRRRTNDPAYSEIRNKQICPQSSMNNYDIASSVFRDWIGRIFRDITQNCVWPILMHCHAGKDRTGVAVALLLKNIGISDKVIIEEYMKSKGTLYPESVGQLLYEAKNIDYLKMSDRQKSKLISLLAQ